MPTALVLRHDPAIGLGNLEQTLVDNGYSISVVDASLKNLAGIDPAAADLLVVLGGEEG
ncbi:glutamine amidotransferase, partial [Glaciibacter flavus]